MQRMQYRAVKVIIFL